MFQPSITPRCITYYESEDKVTSGFDIYKRSEIKLSVLISHRYESGKLQLQSPVLRTETNKKCQISCYDDTSLPEDSDEDSDQNVDEVVEKMYVYRRKSLEDP